MNSAVLDTTVIAESTLKHQGIFLPTYTGGRPRHARKIHAILEILSYT